MDKKEVLKILVEARKKYYKIRDVMGDVTLIEEILECMERLIDEDIREVVQRQHQNRRGKRS